MAAPTFFSSFCRPDADCEDGDSNEPGAAAFAATGDSDDCAGLIVFCNCRLWDVESPSERKRAVVVKQKDKKGEEKQFVEVCQV